MISETLNELKKLLEEVQSREKSGFTWKTFELRKCTDPNVYGYSTWVKEMPEFSEALKKLLNQLGFYEDTEITVYLTDQKELLVYLVYRVPELGWTMRLIELDRLFKELAEKLRLK